MSTEPSVSPRQDKTDTMVPLTLPMDLLLTHGSAGSEASPDKTIEATPSCWKDDPFIAALQRGFQNNGNELSTSVGAEQERGRSRTWSSIRGRALEKDLREEPKTRELMVSEVKSIQNGGPADDFQKRDPGKEGPRAERLDRTALRFGVRLSCVLTVSSLFVLLTSPDQNTIAYPQGVWVYISALMVSWFPSMDIASVVEKTFQRIMGTIIGACLGLACGFLSLLMPNFDLQAVFIGCSIAIVTFLYSFATIQFKKCFIGKYSYASMLCLLTFGISVLPFYTDEDSKWIEGVFRVINVIVGCIIGGLGALLLWPLSTKTVLRDKIQAQVKMAGEASDSVLRFASKTFASRMIDNVRPKIVTAAELSVRRSTGKEWGKDEMDDQVNDSAHEKYNKAIGDWKAVQSVFPLTKYDPFNLCRDKQISKAYRETISLTLARALRIQTTVVLLDGIVRNDRGARCTDRQLDLFCEIGELIKTMLTPPYNEKMSETASEDLLDRLEEIRDGVLQESVAVAADVTMQRGLFCGSVGKEDFKSMLGKSSFGMPLCVSSRDNRSLLFLQLVEHLVIRALRLYYMWRKVES